MPLDVPPSDSQQSARVRSTQVPVATPDGTTYVKVPYTGKPQQSQFVADLQDTSGQQPQVDPSLPEHEQLLSQPSTRPNEPITTGSSFGAGSNFLQVPGEPAQVFRRRVVTSLLSSPAADNAVRDFAQRYLGSA